MALNVAFLGYRFMGRAHANALARLPMFFPNAPETNRHTLIGQDESDLTESADRLGFDSISTDWEATVENDEIDVLYNLAPNFLHVEPSVRALENDVHVICEKPLANSLEGADRMVEAAEHSAATAACAFNYRYVPAIQYARNLIEAGELGEIHHVRANYLQDWLVDPESPWSWRLDEEMAGSGSLGDLGAHSLDLAQFLLGEDIARLSGHLKTFVEERPLPGESGDALDSAGAESTETREVTVDDAYTAQVEFENGAMGTFEASRFATGHANANTIEINGSKGSIKFDLERLDELEVLTGDNRGFERVLLTDPDDPYMENWWPAGHIIGWEHTFVHEDYEFLSAIDAGEPYHPSFEDAFQVQELLAAIEESDERGEWVEL